jgi:hypothetical protein
MEQSCILESGINSSAQETGIIVAVVTAKQPLDIGLD